MTSSHSAHGVTRRTVLRTTGIAAILAAGRAPAYAQGTKLHILRWNDFVPACDAELKRQAPEASKARGGGDLRVHKNQRPAAAHHRRYSPAAAPTHHDEHNGPFSTRAARGRHRPRGGQARAGRLYAQRSGGEGRQALLALRTACRLQFATEVLIRRGRPGQWRRRWKSAPGGHELKKKGSHGQTLGPLRRRTRGRIDALELRRRDGKSGRGRHRRRGTWTR